MDLLQNPFHILAATPHDSRRRIMELADERSLLLDSSSCIQARSELTNPRRRLSVEVAWLPGVDPTRIKELLSLLESSPSDLIGVKHLTSIARANLLAAGLSKLSECTPEIVAQWILEIAQSFDDVDPQAVQAVINEERRVSGFPLVTDLPALEAEIQERRRHYRDVFKYALDKLQAGERIVAMTVAVESATDGGGKHGPILISDLVDAYEVEAQALLEKEESNIEAMIAKLRAAAETGASDTSLASLVEQLIQAVEDWDVVAQPIQVSTKSRGLDHTPSRRVAVRVRELAVDLFNKHGKLAISQQLNEMIQRVFAEVAQVAERAAEDADTLSEMANDRARLLEHSKNMNGGTGNGHGSSAGRWILGIIGVVFVLWLVISAGQDNNVSSYNSTPRSQSQGSPQATASRAAEASSTLQSLPLIYTKPSVGTKNVLSVPEIRWCVREGIRIDAMRDLIVTSEGIAEFNRIVGDYNGRCGDFRYYEGYLSQAERDVEPYRNQIISEAINQALQLDREGQAAPFAAGSGASPSHISIDSDGILENEHVGVEILEFKYEDTPASVEREWQTLYERAQQLVKQERFEEAIEVGEQALRLWDEKTENGYIASNLDLLAVLYSRQGRYRKAEPLLDRSIALYQQIYGPRDPRVIRSLKNRARLYRATGRRIQAEQLENQLRGL